MILPGSNSQALGAALAAATGEPLGQVTCERFDDGEILTRVPEDVGKRAVVVGATVSPSAHLELLQLQDAAREAGAETVVTVLPYMGYGRQDEAFRPGEPVSARAVARAISTGTDRVLVVEPHEPGVTDYFDVPATAVSAAGALADGLPTDLADPLFLGPDEGATALVETVRDGYGRGATDAVAKERDRETGAVSITAGDVDVADRDVVLVDDIVATGSTMSEAVAAIEDGSADRVFVACVHAVLADGALTRLSRAGVADVIATDTVERPASQVSVAESVADHL